jgi:tetratricopeptide (TPR) repeat protein
MTQPQSQATQQPQKKTRRAMLEEFVVAHPNDGFARYGLAMECASTGDTPAAVENYEKLLVSHPEYVSGYFQYGQFLAKISRTDDARRILKAGIEAAHRSGDQHAAAEMETALAQL